MDPHLSELRDLMLDVDEDEIATAPRLVRDAGDA